MNEPQSRRIAGIELGGTKVILSLWQDGALIDDQRFATTTPGSVMAAVLTCLRGWWADARFDAIGVAAFGPVSLDVSAADYGRIRTTPKPHWTGADLLTQLKAAFDCPIGLETDVNAAAIAEYRWGAGQGATSLIYLTVGTGVGGGVLVEGRPLHGRLHPEMGHMLLRRPQTDGFAGVCPFHGDCVEGLLAGPALAARFGVPAETLATDDPAWQQPGADLAQFLLNLIHAFAPQKILIGGGVGMGAGGMLARAKALLPQLLGGYYPDVDAAAIDAMITQPLLGDRAGPLGSIAVGLDALKI